MKISSKFILYPAFLRIASSIGVFVINLNTITSFFWPIRWALSWACRSIWGFQSESNNITESAVWRLRPNPPALVLNRKTSYSESF